MSDMDSSRVIIYHSNCYDGVTAAMVCYFKFGKGALYLPMNYSDSPPDLTGKDVVIVDFSFKRDIVLKIKERARSLLILDHHKTAEKELQGLDYAIFDMNRSGAGLAWDYYFGDQPIAWASQNRNILVDYIEDRDLWKFKKLDSREVNAWIQSWDIDLETWINTVEPQFNDMTHAQRVSEGKTLLRQQTKLVKSICYNAELKRIGDAYIGPYVQTSILMSEVCENLLAFYPDYPFAFYSFKRKDGKFQYGLRSRSWEDFDVSIIAKQFGGGGHKNAAGFELDREI